MRSTFSFASLAFVLLAACSAPAPQTTTADQIRAALDLYEKGDPSVTDDRLTALLARLDADVAMAAAKEAETPPAERAEPTRQHEALVIERRDLQGRYVKARIARLGEDAGKALKGIGEEIGKGVEEAGRRMRETMQEKAPGNPATPHPPQ